MQLLKSLELNGFKSFAQRTVFDFPKGITAIVGPNGSGKSNVIDAIRWLLGEREAKNLRGAKVEDLIFAGTPDKPRMGQAQAVLHFNNHGKFFPVDFAEVTVSREVRRDGASRYFLNKSEVRLKDVVDFFARARLGTKGLVVVSQGNSDMFIQAAPRERREMIEEMLGLREYQIKRTDAERRLEHTRVNLEKSKALIEEILPHLRSLKRQTSRWEKREALASELKEMEDAYFGYRFAKIQDHTGAILADIDAHQKERAALEAERKKAEENLRNVEAEQPKEREEIKKIRAQTQDLLHRKSELQREVGRLEAQIELGAREDAGAEPSYPNLVPLVQKIKHELEAHIEEEDMEELRRIIELLLDDVDVALANYVRSGAKHEKSALAVQFEKIRKELQQLEKELESLRDAEKSLEKHQEHFYEEFRKASAALSAQKEKLDAWEAKHRERLFEKEKYDMQKEELTRQAAQSDRRAEEFKAVRGAHAFSDSELSAFERKIFKARGDLAAIGEIDHALIKEAKDTEERYAFLERESGDLTKASGDLQKLIEELSEKIQHEFTHALQKINKEFTKFFHLMFNGGHAKLKLKEEKEKLIKKKEAEGDTPEPGAEAMSEAEAREKEKQNEGIEIELGLPRKRIHSLEMLSGGERSLVGIAALFALISVSPPPFLVLDEIDAALDERNARRFSDMVKEFAHQVQFVIVTHNRATMEAADVLYGVTMNSDGTSKVLSLKLDT